MFNIETPPRYHLERAPLAQVVVQIRFPLVAHFHQLMGIASIQDDLQDLLPYMEGGPMQSLSIQMGPGGMIPIPENKVLWKFTGDDGWEFTLEPGGASLLVNGENYHGIEDFRERFSRVLLALSKTGRVRRCDRLGLRYINAVESLPGDEKAWMRWFKKELLGWVGSDILSKEAQTQSSVTQTQILVRPSGPLASAPADIQALIRHGILPAGTEIPVSSDEPHALKQGSYVLDVDMFIQAAQRFDPDAVIEQFGALHSQIDAFFRWSLTEEGEQHFEVVDL